MSDDSIGLTQLTTAIVASYVEHNAIRAEELPDLIRTVHAALGRVDTPPAAPAPGLTAAQIRRSITPDALISFEDNKPYKQLKRHLTALGMTPADYRAKWGLPDKYPMVAASYSATRSALAKAAGLGRKASPAPAAPAAQKTAAPPAKKAAPAAPKPRIKGKLGLFGRGKAAS